MFNNNNRRIVVVLVELIVLLLTTTKAMAVDRSKFRTCAQTSFCRRHRNGSHKSMFQYKLQKDTVHFHTQQITNDDTPKDHDKKGNADGESSSGGGGVWQSLSRSLLGSGKDNKKKEQTSSTYVAGPTPTVTGLLTNTQSTGETLNITITCLQQGMVRVRITEVYGTTGTPYEKPRVTYDELVLESSTMHPAGHALLVKDITTNDVMKKIITKDYDKYIGVQYGDDADGVKMILLLQIEPFVITLYRESDLNNPLVTLGSDRLMHFEVRRSKDKAVDTNNKVISNNKDGTDGTDSETQPEKEIIGYWEDGLARYSDGTTEEKKDVETSASGQDHRQLTEAELDQEGLWEENFGSHTDSKPYGPMSVGFDITFPSSQHIFGIPEHASSTILQTTVPATGDDEEQSHYKEPYRLYNLDVFQYELDETMALYGHVPIVVSQSMTTQTVGVFWFNPTETFVDVKKNTAAGGMTTHWISESGIIDVFLLPGPDPASLYRQYGDLTGVAPVPPMFALGYHQCRWNYKDEKDVYTVHGKFEELDYPYDVLWLDIEHTNDKRYFTWDAHLFPNPTEMINTLAATGRRMVTIIDPHIKRDDNYYIHHEATANGLYIRDKDGSKDYDGWCWPGSSSYLDFTAAHVRQWWAEQFAYSKYVGSTPTLFTWNDMNEPSVFNGPEVSMQKDLLNLNGVEHREWHNLYGMLFHRATSEGQVQRNSQHNVRPFVLSRSFFAGSQRYGSIWTGDNEAEWGHLAIAAPMLLSMNIAALSFVGADVGGFFGDPDAELFTRWMQAGAYQPFFRGHAHHDSKRREPWMFDDDTLYRLRRAAMARYALLPYWYTTFHIAETTGMPVMRTMWMQYPKTEILFPTDDQYLIGSDLLVKPITSSGITFTNVMFPTDHIWYDAQSLKLVSSKVAVGQVDTISVPADIETIPVYQRGGSILARKLRLRRSTIPMKTDPYTIYVALDDKLLSSGKLYMDDEETFGYRTSKEYSIATFTANGQERKNIISLRNSVEVGTGWSSFIGDLASDRLIERIVVMVGNNNNKKSPKTISIGSGNDKIIQFTYTEDVNVITIRKPDLSALTDWELLIHY